MISKIQKKNNKSKENIKIDYQKILLVVVVTILILFAIAYLFYINLNKDTSQTIEATVKYIGDNYIIVTNDDNDKDYKFTTDDEYNVGDKLSLTIDNINDKLDPIEADLEEVQVLSRVVEFTIHDDKANDTSQEANTTKEESNNSQTNSNSNNKVGSEEEIINYFKNLDNELNKNFKMTVKDIKNKENDDKVTYEVKVVPPPRYIKIKKLRHNYNLVKKYNEHTNINLELDRIDLEKYKSKIIKKDTLTDSRVAKVKEMDSSEENIKYSEIMLYSEISRYIGDLKCTEVKKILKNDIKNVIELVSKYNQILYDWIIPKIVDFAYELEKTTKTEDKEVIQKYFPVEREKLINDYEPWFADKTKWNFSREEFLKDKKTFIIQYFKFAFKFPVQTISSLVFNTGNNYSPNFNLWGILGKYGEETQQIYSQSGKEDAEMYLKFMNEYPVKDEPIVNLTFLDSLNDEILKVKPVISNLFSNIGLYFWILILCFAYCIYIKQYRNLIMLLPIIGLWITTIAAPMVDIRYIYSMFLTTPLFIGVILSDSKEIKENKNER